MSTNFPHITRIDATQHHGPSAVNAVREVPLFPGNGTVPYPGQWRIEAGRIIDRRPFDVVTVPASRCTS